MTIQQLRELSDDELVRLHDKVAANTNVGVDYYLDEVRRRQTAAAMRSSHRLAFASFVLGIINAVVAVVAVVIALSA